MPRRRDHQDIARLDQIDGVEHGTEVRRLAERGDGAAEQARLPPCRQERADGRIDLTDVAAEVDGHRNRHPAPPVDLRRGEPVGLGMSDGHWHG
jgi:hypothetical protein